MKNKFSKILVSAALSLSLAAGFSAGVLGIQSGVLMGENNINNPVISVVVPTDLNFTLDPFELESVGNQIAPANYVFINRTAAPVKVTLNVTAVLNEGVTLVDDPSALGKDDDSAQEKLIFLGILGADGVETQDLTYDSAGTASKSAKGVYDASKDTLVPFDAGSNTATIMFALAPAVNSSFAGVDALGNPLPENTADTLAWDNKGIGLFQFYAEMNTYAGWEAGDVSFSASYTITPLRASTYENYLYNGGFTEGGWGTQLKGEDQPYIMETPALWQPPEDDGSEETFEEFEETGL